MSKFWHWQTQCFINSNLLGRIGNVVIAADHMSDFHIRIVNDYHIVVNRHATGTNDDWVADYFIGKLDRATNNIFETDRVFGNLQPDGGGLACRTSTLHLSRIEFPALAGVNGLALFGQRLLAFALQFLGGTEAVVRFSFID